jgi:hypothetical protein
MATTILNTVVMGIGLWVFASWIHVAIVAHRKLGIITPWLVAIWFALREILAVAIVWFFGPAALNHWIEHALPLFKSSTVLAALTEHWTLWRAAGCALLVRVAWLELQGFTHEKLRLQRWIYGLIGVFMSLFWVSGGMPTIKIGTPVIHERPR